MEIYWKTFNLREKYGLPNNLFFQYLQLRHAIFAQSRISNWELTSPMVLTQLVSTKSKKGQISSIYGSFICQVSKAMSFKCGSGWSEDIGHISDEEWSSILHNVLKVPLSSAQKLTNCLLFIAHIVLLINYINSIEETVHYVPGSKIDNGMLIHMLWKCPKLIGYWTEVINRIWNLTLKVDPKLCLLDWLDEELNTPHTYVAILWVLFIARKLIARKWLFASRPPHMRNGLKL